MGSFECSFAPGLYQSPGEQVKKAGSEEAAIMFAPSSTITVTKDKIEIKKDDTKITVTSDSIKMEKGKHDCYSINFEC